MLIAVIIILFSVIASANIYFAVWSINRIIKKEYDCLSTEICDTIFGIAVGGVFSFFVINMITSFTNIVQVILIFIIIAILIKVRIDFS